MKFYNFQNQENFEYVEEKHLSHTQTKKLHSLLSDWSNSKDFEEGKALDFALFIIS